MIATVGFIGVIAFLTKIVIHSYLLYKVGKFKVTSADNPARFQYLYRIWFDVPPHLRFMKFTGNFMYSISILCLVFFLMGLFYKHKND